MTINLHPLVTKPSTIYEQDYLLWLKITINQIRAQDFDGVDWENLLEELESLGKADKNALKSRLTLLLLHLLKYRYQSSYRSNSWLCTINEQRRQIDFALEDSPSLQNYLIEIFAQCYAVARRDAAKETGLLIDTFPAESPFTTAQILNPDYLPTDELKS